VALAKLRLAPDDAMVTSCMVAWGQDLELRQAYEEAAQWCVT
jgi:hypothetical protein